MEKIVVKRRWIVLMTVITVIAFAGLFASEPTFEADWSKINGADVSWLITATIFVLMMTPGLSFFYGGMVGAKNVISTMLQSFIAMGLISVLWVAVGFSLCFGDDIGGVIGNPLSFLMFQNVGADTYVTPTGKVLGGATIPLALYALFQMKFAIITPSLITGSFAERVRFSGYMWFMVFFFFLIYCPLAHMTWHPDGLFLKWGVVDFAGGIVVHASSGVAALAGAIFLGRRQRSTQKEEPANIPFVLLGAAMLWLGWFGFNAGSSLHADGLAVKAFLNTNTASATAMMTWIFFDCLRGRKPSAMGAAVGCVVGLVAITPSAGYVTVGQSIFISFVITLICNTAVYWRAQSSIDDALDVFPTHGTGGIFGTVLTGIFIREGLVAGTWDGFVVFLYHLLAIVIVFVYTFGMSYFGYWLIDRLIPMRVSLESERVGLDLSQHDEHYGLAHIGERELAEYEEHIREKNKQ
ncbi:ammonium transporter [Palleniella intestinalis]|jgi:ammonium transporter|uniref:ammonium transporter n=1 Tax=Palleniella intestinalis TaxID=2736291 RepID=UPI001C1300A7|nr:ammonium transporter [Palleniella intestinalis]